MGDSALQKFMGGGTLSPKQAEDALTEAAEKIGRGTATAKKLRENMKEGMTVVLNGVEAGATLFAASTLEGYYGTEKMKLGGIDGRYLVGLPLEGIGIVRRIMGKDDGSHIQAIGSGLLGSGLASTGMSVGRTLAEKKAEKKADAPAAPAATPSAPPKNEVKGISGALRELSLSGDDDAGDEAGARGRRGGGRRSSSEWDLVPVGVREA